MLVIEYDDLTDKRQYAVDMLTELKKVNPAFKATVYAIPACCSPSFLSGIPPWVEVAVHGWEHLKSPPDSECGMWTKERMRELLDRDIIKCFAKGFKAPHYIMSPECYEVLAERGYWVSIKNRQAPLIPKNLKFYINEIDKNSWYGHIGRDHTDSIVYNFDELKKRVKAETEFKFVSEVVK